MDGTKGLKETTLSVNVFTAPGKSMVGERPKPFGEAFGFDPITSTLIFGEYGAVLVDAMGTVAETIFSTAEEQQREPLEIGGKVLFYPDFALRTAGGDVSVLAPWTSYVLQDRELISGQNPFSDEALLKLLLPALDGKKKSVSAA